MYKKRTGAERGGRVIGWLRLGGLYIPIPVFLPIFFINFELHVPTLDTNGRVRRACIRSVSTDQGNDLHKPKVIGSATEGALVILAADWGVNSVSVKDVSLMYTLLCYYRRCWSYWGWFWWWSSSCGGRRWWCGGLVGSSFVSRQGPELPINACEKIDSRFRNAVSVFVK